MRAKVTASKLRGKFEAWKCGAEQLGVHGSAGCIDCQRIAAAAAPFHVERPIDATAETLFREYPYGESLANLLKIEIRDVTTCGIGRSAATDRELTGRPGSDRRPCDR